MSLFGPTIEVANIRGMSHGWQSDPECVYIGRAGHGLTGEWGNPFTVDESGRDAAVDRFEAWMKGEADQDVERERRRRMLDNLTNLRGKSLVCFCAPRRCHGDVLAALATAETVGSAR